ALIVLTGAVPGFPAAAAGGTGITVGAEETVVAVSTLVGGFCLACVGVLVANAVIALIALLGTVSSLSAAGTGGAYIAVSAEEAIIATSTFVGWHQVTSVKLFITDAAVALIAGAEHRGTATDARSAGIADCAELVVIAGVSVIGRMRADSRLADIIGAFIRVGGAGASIT